MNTDQVQTGNSLFQVAAGSVIGRDHILAGRNNQDAYCCHHDGDSVFAVVCDGCSGGRHSEVGAKLAARMLVAELCQSADAFQTQDPAGQLAQVQQTLLSRLEQLLAAFGGKAAADVNSYLLFTILGAILGPKRGVIFALGDGLVFLNGKSPPLLKQERPDYLSYALIPEALERSAAKEFNLRILAQFHTEEFNSLALCTDGAAALLADGASAQLAEFWTQNCFFENSQALTRRLTQINREVRRIDWGQQVVEKTIGPLHDDTTIVVVRRRKA